MKVAPVSLVSVYGVSAPSPAAVRPPAEQAAASSAPPSSPQLTPAERELFIRLFPESAPYIARHVLFTADGRLREPDIYKGTLVDIRV
ncbi:hypothetical protein HRbin21_01455 [bacterium HR21]|nr:hypothetical protein HRbin21_01455 [bacterium HR21]